MASSKTERRGGLSGALRTAGDELAVLARLLAWAPVWLLVAVLAGVLVFATQRPVEFVVDVGSPRDDTSPEVRP